MPIKLVGTVILSVIVGIFCGFNTADSNKCDINLIFYQFQNIPVFLTVLLSFLMGVIIMLPFTIKRKKDEREEVEEEKEDEPQEQKPAEDSKELIVVEEKENQELAQES